MTDHPTSPDRVRYARTMRLFWGASIAAEAEYRLNFVIAAASAALNLAVGVFGLHLFYRTGLELGGWSWDEALAVLGAFTFLHGMSSVVLDPNLSALVLHVQSGTLDFVLLKPMDSQFQLSTRRLSLWGLPELLLGIGLLGLAAARLGSGPAEILAGFAMLLSGAALFYSLWFILGTTSIWFVKIQNATEVLRHMLAAGRFPITAYPEAWRFVFTWLVPVAFLTSVPAEALAGKSLTGLAPLSLVIALIAFVAARSFWRFALRYYTSASS